VGFNSVEDENGNIMVTGISKKVNKCRNNLMLTQVSAEGMILWTKEVAMDGCVGKTSLALSGMEGFYVGGTLFNFKKDVSSIFIIKISPKGKTEWTRMVGGGFQETCKAMIINAEKELVIAGEITGDNMNTDILLVKATGKTP
jgi:hypothetical protein